MATQPPGAVCRSEDPNEPFRIGVWCAYVPPGATTHAPTTLLPNKGLGFFTHNLVQGFLDLGQAIEVTLLARSESHYALSEFYGPSIKRLTLAYLPSREGRFSLKHWIRAWVTWSDRLNAVTAPKRQQIRSLREALLNRIKRRVLSLEWVPNKHRWAVMLLLGGPLIALCALLWAAYALSKLFHIIAEVLAAPLVTFDAIARSLVARFGPPEELEALDLRAFVSRFNCDVWVLPSPSCNNPIGLATVLFIHHLPACHYPEHSLEAFDDQISQIVPYRAANATLVCCSPDLVSDADLLGKLGPAAPKVRMVSSLALVDAGGDRAFSRPQIKSRKWQETASECLGVLREAAQIHGTQAPSVFDLPVPRDDPPPTREQPLEVLLFLQVSYLAGVWETTKALLGSLVEINRERRLLRLTFAVTEDQENLHELKPLMPQLPVERLRVRNVSRAQAQQLLGADHPVLVGAGRRYTEFTLAHCAATFRADAWFALVDRFRAPLLPVRPFGVLIYDMIQKHVPEIFSNEFFHWAKSGMAPTARLARAVVTTNEATQADVRAEYHLEPAHLVLAPAPCEPHSRFARLTPDPILLPAQHFILNVANASQHKGAPVLLRALSRLKARLKEGSPLLVLCGCNTDRFSPTYRGPLTDPYWKSVRALVLDLGLREGRDVLFLGYASDRRLLDLFQRCSMVVNAASHDNGTFSLIEGHYFGRPTLSARYPAAEFLYQRFGVPVKYFPINDDAVLAGLIEQTLIESPLTDQALHRARRHLANPKFGSRRYGEQIYDLLVRLATEGRAERLGRGQAPGHRPPTIPLYPPPFPQSESAVPA